MKNCRNILLIIVFIFWTAPLFSQSVTGQWYGIGQVGKEGNYSQYLSELILNQKGNKVSGEFNYYFKSTYSPSKVTGTYNSKTRVLELQLLPLLNFKSTDINGADCPMKGVFILKVSKVESVLSGLFETTDQYKYTCPEISIRLKKEIIKPGDLKKETFAAKANEKTEKLQESEKKNKVSVAKDQLKTTANIHINQPDIAIVNTDVQKQIYNPTAKVMEPAEKYTLDLIKRTFEESPVIEVDVDSLQLILYDNGEVDNDTIALFHNRKLLASNLRLSTQPINFTIAIDTTIHEISMLAENLGYIPPNTALCIIMAGDKRYELLLTSTYIKNGTIRFRKRTPSEVKTSIEYYK